MECKREKEEFRFVIGMIQSKRPFLQVWFLWDEIQVEEQGPGMR